MRLQLTVQRHSLPPVQILWTAGVLRPPYAAAGASCTISQFLEQVNDVIPLECEDWGLEDYAVEVRGFECLHFAELEQVLKEDDEVCIRPLQTLDLRFRKVSGRHQISADGKHLIDGVAFGRPFLRRADRPSVRIPPRKRRRITYDEEDENVGERANNRQLTVRANFDDADASDEDSDDKDDEDFSAVEEEDLADELHDLQNDLLETDGGLEDAERALNLDGVEEASGMATRSRRQGKHGLGLQGPALLELLDENGRPYLEEYNNPFMDLFNEDEPLHEHLANKTSKRRRTKRLRDTAQKGNETAKSPPASPQSASGQAPSGSMKTVQSNGAETTTPATVRLDSDLEVFNAEGVERANTNLPDMDESDKENAEPQEGEESDLAESPFVETDTSSAVSSSSESESGDTSSAESSSSSSSESDDQILPSLLRNNSSRSSSGSSNTSSSDSSSPDSAPERLSSNISQNRDVEIRTNGSEFQPITPGQGKNQTRKRNQRRRDNKRRTYLVKIGVLAPNATLADFRSADAERKNAGIREPDRAVEESTLKSTDFTAAFEAKRNALLASIDAGGIDVGAATDAEDEAPDATERVVEDSALDKSIDDIAMADTEVEVQNSQLSRMDEAPSEYKAIPEQPMGKSEEAIVPPDSTSPQSSKRRAKLDLASSRRLLFGSLGLRAPKTKEDESNLRDQLAKGVRLPKENQGSETARPSEDFIADSIGEDQSWKDKVILSAVECCHEGVRLSTPPFPFVQRWDPQQQRGYGGRGGRGKTNSKKRKRKSKQYYEDEEEQAAPHDVSQQQVPSYFEAEDESNERAVKPKLDGQSQDIVNSELDERAVNDQLMRETEGISVGMHIEAEKSTDLPDLPEDISSCPDLDQENCIPGTIVAFKQLDMSAETNWQPKVSEYKTATIDQLTDDGALRMTLAERDQPVREELYNHETGKRVYGKFEMPGYEDGEDDEAAGIVEILFVDLIHPKLIRAAVPQQHGDQSQQLGEQEVNLEYSEDNAIEKSGDKFPGLAEPCSSKSSGAAHNSNADKIGEQVREEIRELITDAGWRSSINSNALEKEPKPEGYNDDDATKISTPRFTGFSSSPPPNRPETSNEHVLSDSIGIETDESILPQTIAETVAATSPRSELIPIDKVEENLSAMDNVDKDVIWDNIPSKPISAKFSSHETHSSPGSTPKSASQSLRPRGGVPRRKTSPEPVWSFDGANSDNEFPTLENVLASTRSSFESLIPENDDFILEGKSSFETIASTDEDQKRQRRSKSEAKRNIRAQSKIVPNFHTLKGEDEEFTPRLSQVPLGSQIVDLTMSSDPIYSPGSDDDDDTYEMPGGPGWVRKTRASSKQLSPPKGGSLRSRTRSTV